MERTFIINGPPQGKDRPRFTRSGHTYTTKKTADYEKLIRESYLGQIKEGQFTSDEPVRIRIRAVFPVPKSDSKAVRTAKLNGEIYPTKKPDCDNIAKVVCDALNGLAYDDDKQIIDCSVQKTYGEEPHVEVILV